MTHNDPDDPGHDMTCPKDIQSFMGQENWRCWEFRKKTLGNAEWNLSKTMPKQPTIGGSFF